MTERIRQLLGSSRFINAVDLDFNFSLSLESKTRLLRPNNINNILNISDRFEEERENSTCYRLNGQLSFLTDNSLVGAFCAIPDDLDWSPSVLTQDGNTPNTTRNWVLQITYPSSSDKDFLIKTKVDNTQRISKTKEGLQIKSISEIEYNGTNKSLLSSVHTTSFEAGDYLYLIPKNGDPNYQGFHYIEELEGLNEKERSKNLILDTDFINSVTNGNFIKITNLSFDDINFLNTVTGDTIVTCDFTGGTTSGDHLRVYTTTPINILQNDYVDIRTGIVPDDINGVFFVTHTFSTGDTTYSFVIDLDLGLPPGTTQNKTMFLRRLDGTPCEYYIRRYKVLTDLKDYEVYAAAFSTNIFSDDISNKNFLFHFNKDIDVGDIRDNLGRPISELYLTVTKRAGSQTFNFSPVTSSFEENKTILKTTDDLNIETLSNWVLGDCGSVEKNELDEHVGDFVEYDSLDLRERVISRVIHRFAPIRDLPDNNFDGGNGEGYYYYPHNIIKIRTYSDVLETEIDPENSIYPDYAKNYFDGSVAWRDLLSIGYFEDGENGVNYPFLNGCHYIYNNYSIYIRRQRPAKTIDIITEENQSITKFKEVC